MKSRKSTPAETQGNPGHANPTKGASVDKLTPGTSSGPALFHAQHGTGAKPSSQYSNAQEGGPHARNRTTKVAPSK